MCTLHTKALAGGFELPAGGNWGSAAAKSARKVHYSFSVHKFPTTQGIWAGLFFQKKPTSLKYMNSFQVESLLHFYIEIWICLPMCSFGTVHGVDKHWHMWVWVQSSCKKLLNLKGCGRYLHCTDYVLDKLLCVIHKCLNQKTKLQLPSMTSFI